MDLLDWVDFLPDRVKSYQDWLDDFFDVESRRFGEERWKRYVALRNIINDLVTVEGDYITGVGLAVEALNLFCWERNRYFLASFWQ